MHAKEIIGRYYAEPAKFQHKALLISVNQKRRREIFVQSNPFRLEGE